MTSQAGPTITMEEAKVLAQRAGLTLSDAQLAVILPGLARSRQMLHDIRQGISKTDEPSGAFDAAAGH